ncbi:MAG: alpha/beta hydrolase-fold protein [Gilvibacter sp.]
MKTNRSLLLCFFLLFIGAANGQQAATDSYQSAVLESKTGILPYRILPPKNLDKNKKYPLILFLHGYGERGTDNQLQLTHGASFFASDSIQNNYEAYVVFPQCDTESKWTDYKMDGEGKDRMVVFNVRNSQNKQQELLEELLENLLLNHAVDKAKIYVGGLSMGGMGTLELIKRNPKTFAAAFVICGGTHLKAARKIKNTPLWLFHGKEDNVVPAKYATQLYDVLLTMKANVKITLYPETGHDSWTQTFKEPELLPWLFSHSKKID